MEQTHYFTLDEAQAKLTEILPKLGQMMELKLMCDRKGYDVYRHEYFGGMGPNGQKAFPPEMEQLAAIATEIDAAGVQIKDLNSGLIDFPHRRRNGEVVLLCYQYGEPEILAWHTIEGGFPARKSLSAL